MWLKTYRRSTACAPSRQPCHSGDSGHCLIPTLSLPPSFLRTLYIPGVGLLVPSLTLFRYGGGPALPRALVSVRDSETGDVVFEPQLYPVSPPPPSPPRLATPTAWHSVSWLGLLSGSAMQMQMQMQEKQLLPPPARDHGYGTVRFLLCMILTTASLTTAGVVWLGLI